MSCLSGLECLKPSSGDGGGADAKKFVIPQGFDLEFADGDHGEGISRCIENLQLVAWFLASTSRVVFENGRQIAATEIFLRQVIGEINAGEERVFHGLTGYKAMKGGAGFLVAQMETTCKRRPLGPCNAAHESGAIFHE